MKWVYKIVVTGSNQEPLYRAPNRPKDEDLLELVDRIIQAGIAPERIIISIDRLREAKAHVQATA